MINKVVSLIIIYFTYLGCVSAQFKCGGAVGVNSTSIIGDTPQYANYAPELGYSVGFFGEVLLFEDVSIFLQPIYSSKNTTIQYDVGYQYEPYDSTVISMDYLELPLGVKVMAGQTAYVIAGLSFNIPLSANLKNNFFNEEHDILDFIEPLSLSANFGVGIQFEIGKPILFFELRYSQGLSNLLVDSIDRLSDINRLKSNNLQIFAGVLFTL